MKYTLEWISCQPLIYPKDFSVLQGSIKYEMIFNPNEHSVIFLSYDEPNCEEHYQHLLSLKPDALRVHGIKGSDAAHKQVAELSSTKNVIIVDGDNFVNRDFFQNTIELKDDVDLSTSVLSFSGKNIINGTQYGNGGIKVWPVELLKNMKTHESSDDANTSVDFDFHTYLQLNRAGSNVVVNGSPKQAWRAGFREGVKLCLNDGKLTCDLPDIDWRNYDRLWNWMHIGSDVENGIWAIYGARLGVAMTTIEKFDYVNVRDFDWLDRLFDNPTPVDLRAECNRLGKLLRKHFNDPRIKDVYEDHQSIRYKDVVKPILRSPETFLHKEPTEYDIVFISYNERNADYNYQRLVDRFPRAKRVHGVKGIHNAHIEAARQCSSDYFWVVDADADIVDTFNFQYEVPFYEQEAVRVWRAKNPVNDLVYGNGGVKLLPRVATLRMTKDKPDMTTSICKHYIPIMELSNINEYNTDPFATWRSAFRECAKLASSVIDRQNDKETMERLDLWCILGFDRMNGEFSIQGALMGRMFGERNKGKIEELKKINDFAWLKEQYDRFYSNTVA